MGTSRSFTVAFLHVLLAVLVWAGTAEAARPVVTDVRVGANGGDTRFVIEVDRKVGYKIFTLENPARVVIDLPEVGWRLPSRPLPSKTGMLERFRYGLFKRGTTRLVLETRAGVAIRQSFLIEPRNGHRYRLVVDMARAESAAPAAPAQVSTVARPRVRTVKPAPKARVSKAVARFPLPPRKPERRFEKRVIAIDPGHGGVDPGTLGSRGTYEKHITLAMARELRDQLKGTGRYKVVLTRDRDVFIRLRDRVSIAREGGAELFVSLHADAIKDRSVRGASVYTLSEKASDKEAAALAEKENKADVIAGIDLTHEDPDVTNILISLAQRETRNESALFAARLVRELKNQTRTLRKTHRFAGFAVLKAPDVPSVLVELGFLSNKTDEKNLRSRKYRRTMAKSMVRAIDRYFERVEEAAIQ